MDRQLLLEQKRQRLQELKQRRSQQHQKKDPDVDVDAIIDSLNKQKDDVASISVGIDVSTQTIEQVKPVHTEGIRYDKAIQTIEDIQEEPKVQDQPVKTNQLTSKQQISESELNQALSNSLKLLNKLTVTSTIELESKQQTSPDVESGYFHEVSTITPTTGGSIIDMDIFEDLIAIAYKNSKYSAIVYSNSKPQYFLTSISEITIIQFDINNSNRIIVGCKNGTISIYELSSQLSPIVSPTLTTPLYSTLFKQHNHHHNFTLHTNPIILITQLKINDNNCLITVCKRGIINLWSSNLLAVPKMDSINLFEGNSHITISFISHAIFTSNQQHYIDSSYLNSLVFIGDGKIYGLNKDKSTRVIQTMESGITSIITDVAEIDSSLITSHMEWSIKVWKEDAITIPVPYLVKKIIVRPNHDKQFITISHKPFPTVDLWDLSKRLYVPIVTVCQYKVETVEFNKEGTQIILGKTEGATTL
ncbi:hypothetical protein JA1_005021 [Spathaspora sp. JA1]|nr:hypothetical protein JA1_005021 [Spathaspora sp. JA1]